VHESVVDTATRIATQALPGHRTILEAAIRAIGMSSFVPA